MTTILSVEQGDKGTWKKVARDRPKILKGLYADEEWVHLPVPVAAVSNNGKIPVRMIGEAVQQIDGHITALGHSTEAAYISKAMRDGAFDNIPPDQLSFMLLGNPERRYGGWTYVPKPFPVPWKIIFDDEVGLPVPCPWPVADLVRRYEPVGDAANVPNPSLRNRLHDATFGWAYHGNYNDVAPSDATVRTRREGTVAYLLHGLVNPRLEPSYVRPPEFR